MAAEIAQGQQRQRIVPLGARGAGRHALVKQGIGRIPAPVGSAAQHSVGFAAHQDASHRTGIGRESFAGEQCADLLPRKRLSALQRTGDRSVRPAEKPFVQGKALSPGIGIVGRADPRGTQAKHPAHIFTRYQMPGRTQQVHPHDPPLLQRTPHGRCVRAGHAHADRPTGHPCVLRLHSPHPSHERGGIAGPRRGEPLAPHTQRRNGIGCAAAPGLISHILDD